MGKVRPIVAKAGFASGDKRSGYLEQASGTNREKVRVGGRGRDAAHMERMRRNRAPFTDPRDGRLFRQIRFAFTVSRGEPLSTSSLLKSCYPFEHLWGKLRSWHRTNVGRVARRVAVPIGRAPTPGRPLIWKEVPELMELRSPGNRWRRRRK
jgi:hypothetical protein